MPGNSRLDQSLVPSLIDGIAMKTVEMKNPIANAMISLVLWSCRLVAPHPSGFKLLLFSMISAYRRNNIA